ncbi:DNA-directed RNA polymerase I polypeptide [Eremomyces bilateralis CBS 781.70]|uniref:DNA-directed RNA polymerase subunit n=1 Tax=Eremomyces bilateralis CBS 781.70 TaxID=1392243 RepID=A0A6G1FUL5_9PEZI|nr:DNA-directed RNA polymerase I polypeptide [Eremomyces bilateralis CBS 781.70]KAF1809585.1 DNA-directed RNA polymerase I polypeptide [Eremomyces bilateralis CBS 781.70]
MAAPQPEVVGRPWGTDTVLFCTSCGSILDRHSPEKTTITCNVCHSLNKNNWPTSVTTKSKPDAFPSALLQKRSVVNQTMNLEDAQTWPSTSQSCPSCNNPTMWFKDVQLRSADEGTTIFYHCPRCNHRYERLQISLKL